MENSQSHVCYEDGDRSLPAPLFEQLVKLSAEFVGGQFKSEPVSVTARQRLAD